jgi:cytochrome c oxidase cbb3-type subunit III
MRAWPLVLMALALAILAGAGCSRLPGKPAPGPEVPRPESVLDPVVLYRENCSGCHGADGKSGPGMMLSDPVYLAIVDDDTLREVVSKGRPGTAMSAFAEKEGGMLTDAQVNAIVRGIRERWSKADALGGDAAPPYATKLAGDTAHGQAVYRSYCASCHGAGESGGPKAGSIVDKAYLALVSDQGLRTLVITGRPDWNAPDWRSNLPGHPMSDQEITDVVAWLASQRPNVAVVAPAATATSTGGGH